MTKLLVNEPSIPTFSSLASHLGVNEALVLQQVHYWLSPHVNRNFFAGCHWVYNTYGQWQAQFPFLSVRTIQRTFQSLEKQELLISFSKCHHLQKTKYYTINYERLSLMKDLLPQKWQHDFSSNHPSSQEFLEDIPAGLKPQEGTEAVTAPVTPAPAEAIFAETISVETVSTPHPFHHRGEPVNATEEDRSIEGTPIWPVGLQDRAEKQRETQEESQEKALLHSDVRPTSQFGALVKNEGEQNFSARRAAFSQSSVSLLPRNPVCEGPEPSGHFDVNQVANLARSYNNYTEITDIEEREEKREK